MRQIQLLSSARYHIRTGSPRSLEKTEHIHGKDYGENDLRRQLNLKVL